MGRHIQLFLPPITVARHLLMCSNKQEPRVSTCCVFYLHCVRAISAYVCTRNLQESNNCSVCTCRSRRPNPNCIDCTRKPHLAAQVATWSSSRASEAPSKPERCNMCAECLPFPYRGLRARAPAKAIQLAPSSLENCWRNQGTDPIVPEWQKVRVLLSTLRSEGRYQLHWFRGSCSTLGI